MIHTNLLNLQKGMIAISFAFEDEVDKLYKAVNKVVTKWEGKRLGAAPAAVSTRTNLVKPKGFIHVVSEPSNKKNPKKITKDLIGVPSNFQHISHIGPSDKIITRNIEVSQLQNQAPRIQNAMQKAQPRRPPPLPPKNVGKDGRLKSSPSLLPPPPPIAAPSSPSPRRVPLPPAPQPPPDFLRAAPIPPTPKTLQNPDSRTDFLKSIQSIKNIQDVLKPVKKIGRNEEQRPAKVNLAEQINIAIGKRKDYTQYSSSESLNEWRDDD